MALLHHGSCIHHGMAAASSWLAHSAQGVPVTAIMDCRFWDLPAFQRAIQRSSRTTLRPLLCPFLCSLTVPMWPVAARPLRCSPHLCKPCGFTIKPPVTHVTTWAAAATDSPPHVQVAAIGNRIRSELAPAPPEPRSSATAAGHHHEEGDSDAVGASHRAAARRLAPSPPPSLHPIQRLLRPRRPLPPTGPTRAQSTLRLLQASEAAAVAGSPRCGDAERTLRAVVTRRLHQMLATGSTVLNMDISLEWAAVDLPCIIQCIECAALP